MKNCITSMFINKKIDLKTATIVKVNPLKENEDRLCLRQEMPTVCRDLCQPENVYRQHVHLF